jgi:hypothetical protein
MLEYFYRDLSPTVNTTIVLNDNTTVLSRHSAKDLLIDFKNIYSDNEKKLYWKIVRYISLIIYIKLEYSIEIHYPRDSFERFTYESDKLWSKILYYMLYVNSKEVKSIQLIYKYITIGGYVNLIKYWSNILSNISNIEKIYYTETTYFRLKTEKSNYNTDTDNCIISALYYIIYNIYSDDSILSKTMLKYIIRDYDINSDMISKFSNYLNSSYIDPCRETENKIDMYNLLYDYIIR